MNEQELENAFWRHYKDSESLDYSELDQIQKAVVGLANFGGMACSSGLLDQVGNVGFCSLADAEAGLRMIGRVELADGLARCAQVMLECIDKSGRDREMVYDYEKFAEWLVNEDVSEWIQERIGDFEGDCYATDPLELYREMGKYLVLNSLI